MENNKLILPNEIISPTDVVRLRREIESLDEFFRQSEIRQGGTLQSPPRYSRLLDSIVVSNNFNLLQSQDRATLSDFLQFLHEQAPILHMSFSTDPPGPYIQKIVSWLRNTVGEYVLVRVGLQPNIGAGCIVRTENHSFDFSLRKYFTAKKSYFTEKLHEVVTAESVQSSATTNQTVQGNEDGVSLDQRSTSEATRS